MNRQKIILVMTRSPEGLNPGLDTLAAQGADIRQVDSGYRLVARFSQEPADVVLLDLTGLRQQDLEIIGVLREVNSSVGIVALADRDQRDMAANALCQGADLYLMKPPYVQELVAAVRRATERKAVASAAPAAGAQDERISKLALGVAHEVNNPLTTISGWLQMLMKDHANNPQLFGLLGNMKEEADRIAEVVKQLLAFAQKGPTRREPIDMATMLNGLARVSADECSRRGIQLAARIPEELPPVAGDPQLLRFALEGLLSDAIDATRPTGKIELSCKPNSRDLYVAVHDNGPAFPRETLQTIFEPFNDGRTGKGMRLCVAREIVLSHGGAIEVVSDDISGTEFTVRLPVQP